MKKLLFVVNTYKPGAIPNILNMIIPRLKNFSIYILTLEDSREELLTYAQSINFNIETINQKTYVFGIAHTEDEKREIIQEAKQIVDLEKFVTSILMVSDLSRQRE